VWTISRYSRDRASKANGLNPSVFQFLPCAVDGDAFTPGPKSQALVEKYNLAGSRVLMTVARLWSGDIYKGVDVTIRALPKVARVFPEVKYLAIGRGDDRPRLEKLARDLGVVADCFTFQDDAAVDRPEPTASIAVTVASPRGSPSAAKSFRNSSLTFPASRSPACLSASSFRRAGASHSRAVPEKGVKLHLAAAGFQPSGCCDRSSAGRGGAGFLFLWR